MPDTPEASHQESPVPQSVAERTDEAIAQDQAAQDRATPFVGQWNRLVSTTNWEKGRIICQWRQALLADGQPVTDYSDEAWAQLVGHVTGQHVGRLRRVHQRFGDIHQQYEGLHWSHFQAALDWSDAEMWLEGAIQDGWSVSQMRGRRWEILGTPASEQAEQAALDAASEQEAWDETVDEGEADSTEQGEQPGTESVRNQVADGAISGKPEEDCGESVLADDAPEQASGEPVAGVPERQPLGVACDDLPDDIAEAFEQFKLAIIAQRREGWKAISREGVIECLDALKELADAN